MDLENDQVIGRSVGAGVEFTRRLQRRTLALLAPDVGTATGRRVRSVDLLVIANGRELERRKFTAIHSPEMDR